MVMVEVVFLYWSLLMQLLVNIIEVCVQSFLVLVWYCNCLLCFIYMNECCGDNDVSVKLFDDYENGVECIGFGYKFVQKDGFKDFYSVGDEDSEEQIDMQVDIVVMIGGIVGMFRGVFFCVVFLVVSFCYGLERNF